MKFPFLVVITLSFIFSKSIGQTTLFKGTIMGFESENTILSKNKQKNLNFEGGLKNVSVNYSIDGVEKVIKTDISGDFNLYIPSIGNHRISFSRRGYSTVVLDIFQEAAPNNYQYEGLFILLKKTKDPSVFMGTIKIKPDGKLEYRQGSIEIDKNSIEYQAYNFGLGEKAVSINNSKGLTKIKKHTTPEPIIKIVEVTKNENPIEPTIDSTNIADSNLTVTASPFLFPSVGELDIEQWKLSIDSAKIALQSLDSNSIEYQYLLGQIKQAEEKIKDSETIIQLKNTQLSSANKIITYISLFLILLILFALLLLFFLKQRKEFVSKLEEKNKVISSVNSNLLSSIRFASLIQKSYLQNTDELKKIYPNSFIYNKPKDIVSGDFHWFAEINGTRIMVVADCTGHGVPGAMLTVLGHSTLETIVQDKSITKPSEIIAALNKTIVTTFGSNDEYIIHGMDMTVITSKVGSTEVVLSGAANGLYVQNKKGIAYYDVSPYSLGQEMETDNLKDTIIKLEPNDTLFMFTDGYVDQFKGGTDQIEKFNVKRFENLLSEIGSEKDISNAANKLDKVLLEWKGERSQIDDILIVGLKV